MKPKSLKEEAYLLFKAKGWRFVRVGAVIKELDKCWIDRQGWTTTELADAKVGIKHTYIRRDKGK